MHYLAGGRGIAVKVSTFWSGSNICSQTKGMQNDDKKTVDTYSFAHSCVRRKGSGCVEDGGCLTCMAIRQNRGVGGWVAGDFVQLLEGPKGGVWGWPREGPFGRGREIHEFA